MKKLLLIALIIVGCEDTTAPEKSNLIDLEFVVVKIFITDNPTSVTAPCLIGCNDDKRVDCAGICGGSTTQNYCDDCISGIFDCNGICDGTAEFDCECVCGGDALKQTYYYDNDGDGLGGDYSMEQCSGSEGWVLNSDDEEDRTPSCWTIYTDTLNISSEILITNNGNLAFSLNDKDYSIDVSSCVTHMNFNVIKIIQDTELKVIYPLDNYNDFAVIGQVLPYSSPNEVLFALPK